MSQDDKPTYFVPALEKGLDILEALAASPVPLTLTELSRTLDRSSSVMFRIIDALEKRAYITRDPISGAYRLTLKLYELAHTFSPIDKLLKASLYPMRELADKIHESCHLSVLAHGKLVLVAEELSPDRVRLSVEMGSQVNPVPFASGRLLIAFLDEEARAVFLEADPDHRAMNQAQQKRLARELGEIRQAGHIAIQSIARTGLDLSVVVGNPAIGVTAALAVPFLAGGPNEGREMDQLSAVLACSNKITRALGLTPVAF